MANVTAPTPPVEYVKAWNRLLNDMGPETVHMRLCNGGVRLGDSVFVSFATVSIDGQRVTPKRPFEEQGLSAQDRKSRRRASMQNILVWIGALAAVIGAVTGLVSVFG